MASETHGADHAVEGAAEHAGSAFPPFDTSTFASQLFWLAIAFLLLYVLLSKFILPRLGGVIEQRRGRIASDLDDAARMNSEADDAVVEMEKKLAVARSEARAKADQTRSEIDARIAARTSAKAAELDETLSEAEVRIDAMKASAMSNVGEIAEATTSVILTQLGTKASKAEISAAVKKSVDGVAA